MFYSHQLLARKTSMGQIWMAATMHAKINRRKLNKLNLIEICEAILNPSVPMALRLSGILMGGVVIVYERKVKLLYDDVTRLMVEINEAWKAKPATDPTLLPKRKYKAKKETITLPENQEVDCGDLEQSRQFSSSSFTMNFQRTGYFTMRLDDIDEPDMTGLREENFGPPSHQADPADITLCERFDSYQVDAEFYNPYERFEPEVDAETHVNFTSGEYTQIPTTFVSSPLPKEESQRADDNGGQEPKVQDKQQSDCFNTAHELNHNQRRQDAPKRKRRLLSSFMDCEQTFISGPEYQSWLKDASYISRRGRKRKSKNIISTMKVARLMDLPPVPLCYGLVEDANGGMYYPAPLLKQLMRSMQPPQDSPSGRTSHPPPPDPSLSSPPDRNQFHHGPFIFDGLNTSSHVKSIEKQRANPALNNDEIPAEIFREKLMTNLMNNGVGVPEGNLSSTPGNSDEIRSIPSSGSGHGFVSHSYEVNSAQAYKKRLHSSSKHSSSLDPVAEDNILQNFEVNFELPKLSEKESAPEPELMVETGPTQTQNQYPNTAPPLDKMTESIRTQMKAHFDAPGAPEVESLNDLARGLDRKGAALLFYHTCVLATKDMLKVEQMEPYGDILISKGKHM